MQNGLPEVARMIMPLLKHKPRSWNESSSEETSRRVLLLEGVNLNMMLVELLFQNLSSHQRRQYLESGHFDVIGSETVTECQTA